MFWFVRFMFSLLATHHDTKRLLMASAETEKVAVALEELSSELRAVAELAGIQAPKSYSLEDLIRDVEGADSDA